MLYICDQCDECEPCYLDDHEPSTLDENSLRISSIPTRCAFASMKKVTWRLLTDGEELEYLSERWKDYCKRNAFIDNDEFKI